MKLELGVNRSRHVAQMLVVDLQPGRMYDNLNWLKRALLLVRGYARRNEKTTFSERLAEKLPPLSAITPGDIHTLTRQSIHRPLH